MIQVALGVHAHPQVLAQLQDRRIGKVRVDQGEAPLLDNRLLLCHGGHGIQHRLGASIAGHVRAHLPALPGADAKDRLHLLGRKVVISRIGGVWIAVEGGALGTIGFAQPGGAPVNATIHGDFQRSGLHPFIPLPRLPAKACNRFLHRRRRLRPETEGTGDAHTQLALGMHGGEQPHALLVRGTFEDAGDAHGVIDAVEFFQRGQHLVERHLRSLQVAMHGDAAAADQHRPPRRIAQDFAIRDRAFLIHHADGLPARRIQNVLGYRSVKHRVLRSPRVQLLRSGMPVFLQPGDLIARHLDPGPRRDLLRPLCDPCLDLRDAVQLLISARHRIARRAHAVAVGFDQPGQNRLACQIDDLRLRSFHRHQVSRGARRHNLAALHRHRLQRALGRIQGDDLPMHEQQIRLLRQNSHLQQEAHTNNHLHLCCTPPADRFLRPPLR